MHDRHFKYARWIAGAAIALCSASGGIFALRSYCIESALKESDRLLLLDQKPDLIEQQLIRVLNLDSDNQQALFMLGVTLSRQQRISDAIVALERVNPEAIPESQVALASALVTTGARHKAERVIRVYLESYPEDDEMRRMLFILLVQTMRTPEAIELLEQRLGVGAGLDIELIHLRSLLNVIANPMSAQSIRDTLLKDEVRNSQDPAAMAAIGHSLAVTGQIDRADEYYRRALATDRNNADILIRSADFFLSQGRLQLAEELLSRCNASPQTSHTWILAEYWHLMALIHTEKRQQEDAMNAINRSLAVSARPESLTLKAGLLRKAGRISEAIAIGNQVKEYGRHDFRLLKLSGAVQKGMITFEICSQLAESLRAAGYDRQADAWERLSRTIHTTQ